MVDRKRLEAAFEAMLDENLRAIAFATLVLAHGGDGQLEEKSPREDVPEDQQDELRETLIELMPLGFVFVDLWDWDRHFEVELGDDWLFDAALGSDDTEEDVVRALVDFYLEMDRDYDIDPGVLSPEELAEELHEEGVSFVRSWRSAVVSACLPEELTSRPRGPDASDCESEAP